MMRFPQSTARVLGLSWVLALAACSASDATDDAVGPQGGEAGSASVSGGAPSSAGGLGAGAPSGGAVAAGGGGSSNGGASGASTVAGAGGGISAGAGGTNPSGGGGQAGSMSGGAAGAGGSGAGGPLPPSVTALFPAPGATGVCLDAPLTITFASAPSVGSAGKISIFAKNNPNTAIDTVDLAVAKISDVIGGQTRNLLRPVFVDGTQAVVYFHQHKLAANTAYFVTVSSGSFVDSSKAPIGTVTGDSVWSFTTGPASVASASMAVNRTGSGGFCTIQGAFDAIPANNTTARTITVQANKYHEILYLSGKTNLTLKGSDRTGTVIEYANNDMLNAGTSARPLFYAKGTTGLTLDTLTIRNSTPQGGSQAEALAVNADQVILRNSDFKSLQDTLLLTGRVYVVGSYVEGNVDFVWGNGVTYFDSCEIKTVGRAGAIVQSRNGSGGYGYVFVDSKLTSDPGITGQVLARIDATVYPYSHVAYVNCQMSSAIAPKGWTITPAGTSATGNLRFWEYQSTDASGKALNVSGRDPASKQISASQAAQMRDKATVLGGWNPQ